MKKFLLVLGFTFLYATCSFAQTNQTAQQLQQDNSSTKQYVYCEVTCTTFLGKKVDVKVDYGDRTWGGHYYYKLDGSKYLSNMDAINDMASHGWKIVTVYTAAFEGNSESVTYVLEKMITPQDSQQNKQ